MNTTMPRGAAWNRARYSAYAPFYDAIVAPLQNGRGRSIELLDLQPGKHLLIVGCGTGLDLPLLPLDGQVTAIDLTPTMVRRTAARGDAINLPVLASVMNGQQLAFPAESFDAVALHLILAVVPDPIACAREVARVLRPGGRVVIFDKWLPEGARPSMLRRALNVVTRAAFSDINRHLRPVLEAAGLQLLHDEPAGFGGVYQAALAVAAPR